MASPKPNPLFRLMPSFTDVAFLMPFFFLFSRMEGVRTLLGDGDTGWHIRIGQWILAHGQVPHQDMFSFTKPGAPFYAWEWLWDVIFAKLYQYGSLVPVVVLSMGVICLIFALLFKLVNRACGNPIVAVFVTVTAAMGTTMHWLARPHLFTMLFIVILLSLLQRVREGRTRLLWWLPAMTILWTQLHAGFLAELLILGAYAGGEIVGALVTSSPAKARIAMARRSLPYIATAAACAAATLINPYFYHLHVHIWDYMHDPYSMNNIVEFQSVSFRNGGAGFFEIMLALGLPAMIWCLARKRFGDLLAMAGWAHVALLSARFVEVYMLVAAPIIAEAVVAWIGALQRAPVARWLRYIGELVEGVGAEIAPLDRMWRVHALPVLGMLVFALAVTAPGVGRKLKPEYDEKVYPAKALAALDPSDRVFTDDEWGDYLIYRRFPEGGKVFVDGRSDFYGSKFGQDYLDVMNVKYDWEQTLARFGVDTILLHTDFALAGAVKLSPRWRAVYDDGLAIVFRAARPAAGMGEQTSTSSMGGGGRDLTVTHQKNVIPRDHAFQHTGASTL